MRALKTDKEISLNEILILTEIQAKTRYSCGRNRLLEVAEEAGAVVRIGNKKKGYLREVLDDYFRRKAE